MTVSGQGPGLRGRLGARLRDVGANSDKSPLERHACHVNASYNENGDLVVEVSSSATYLDGEHGPARVSATISQSEIPEHLRDDLELALEAILTEAHDDLKDEVDREVAAAIDHAERVGLPPPANDTEVE